MLRPPALLLWLAALLLLPASAGADPFTAEEEELHDLAMDHQFKAASAMADRLIAADPTRLIPHKVKVYCGLYDLTLDPAEALVPYRERFRRDPGDLVAHYAIVYGGMLLSARIPDGELRKKEFERIRDECKVLVELAPRESEFHMLLARTHLNLLSHHEAGAAIAEAIRIDPDRAVLHGSQACFRMTATQQEENRRWIERYVRAHPGTPSSRQLQLHDLDYEENEAERALRLEALLPSMIGTRMEDDVRMQLALADRKADEHLEAILARGFCNETVKALQLRADRLRDREGWSWFATEELRKTHLRQAVDRLRESERRFPSPPGDLLVLRAKCHYMLEEWAETRACIATLASLGTREARAHADHLYLEGDSYYAEGRHEEARKSYDRVLEGNANFPIPSRLRHLECMVRQYPLVALAQGSTLFLIFLSVLLSVALVAARLRHARRYFKLAAQLALFVTALELALFLRSTSDSAAGALMVTIVGFFKNTAMLSAGMLLAARGGVRPFALLRDLAKAARGRAPENLGGRVLLSLAAMFVCGVSLLAVTYGMMVKYEPHANESVSVAKPLESKEDRAQEAKLQTDWFAIGTLMIMAAAMEEVLFRWFLLGFLQCGLRRFAWSAALAIFATSFLWGVGHMGAVDPWWFRLVQTTVCGLLLGSLRWWFGVESSFLVHTGYNWTQLWLGSRGA